MNICILCDNSENGLLVFSTTYVFQAHPIRQRYGVEIREKRTRFVMTDLAITPVLIPECVALMRHLIVTLPW